MTQELDPSDILEVQDMAAAIARAERLVTRSTRTLLPAAAPSSGGDIFESLGHRPTDDIAGPATPAPVGLLTPIPPAYAPPVPRATASAPRYVTMPSAPTALEDDAFYHPLGRMRSLADVTLDGYRPEPTLLVRAASRRKRFSWVFVAVLLPLLVLAAIAVFANAETTSAPRAPSVASIRDAVPTKLALATTSATNKSVVAAEPPAAKPAAGMPVLDVNSLPAAGSRNKR